MNLDAHLTAIFIMISVMIMVFAPKLVQRVLGLVLFGVLLHTFQTINQLV